MITDFTWKTTMQTRGQWSNIKGILRKGNFRPISIINIHENILILANRVKKYIENLIFHNQERVIPECKTGLVFQLQSV